MSSLPGGMSVQMDAQVKGPQPQSRLLVIIEPREKFNLKREVDIGSSAAYSGGNWTTRSSARSRMSPPYGSPSLRESLKQLLTFHESSLSLSPQVYAGDERITLNIPERQADSSKSTKQDNLDETNISQLSPSENEALMEVL